MAVRHNILALDKQHTHFVVGVDNAGPVLEDRQQRSFVVDNFAQHTQCRGGSIDPNFAEDVDNISLDCGGVHLALGILHSKIPDHLADKRDSDSCRDTHHHKLGILG